MVVSFPELLVSLVSSNPHEAFQKIEELRKQNLGLFLLEMAKQLVAHDMPTNQRQMAALIIKNSVIGQSQQATDALSKQWLAIPFQQRDMIKQILLQGLSLPNNDARSTAAQVVGQIGVIELRNNEWNDLISIMITACKGDSYILKEGTLNALGILCEDIPDGIIQKQSSEILDAIVSGINPSSPPEIHRASIKALLGALNFVGKYFEEKQPRDFIMNVIISSATSPDETVRLFSMQCLVRTAEFYYEYLAPYFESIWQVTVVIIKNDIEKIAQQAIEFWSSICDMELKLFSYIEQEGGDAILHKITYTIAEHLTPVLFECLTKQSDNIYDDDWNISKCSSSCLTLMSQTIRDRIVPISIPFITKCINHENWRYKDAAILALGCISDGPSPHSELPAFIEKALPLLVKHLDDPSLNVRDTTAWTLGEISEHQSSVMEKNAVPVVNALLKGLNSPEVQIAVQCCNALLSILHIYNYDEEDTSPLSSSFWNFFNALLTVSDRPDATENNLSLTAYEAINTLIKNSATDCQDHLIKLIDPFIEKVYRTFDVSVDTDVQVQLQSFIPTILLTITEKIEDLIAPFAEKIIRMCTKIFEFRKIVIDEPIMLIIGVLSVCDNLVKSVFNPMKAYLLSAFKNPEDSNSFIACLQCLNIFCDESSIKLYTHDNGVFCENTIQYFFNVLQNPDAPFDIKPEIFSCLGYISLSIGKNFERYGPAVISSLESASTILIDDSADEEAANNIIMLRKTILETYRIIVHSYCGILLVPRFSNLFTFIEILWNDKDNRTKGIIKHVMLLLRDISNNLKAKEFLNQPLIKEIIHFGKNRTTSTKTREAAKQIRI